MNNVSAGETNLAVLLKNMAPVLHANNFVFLTFTNASYGDHAMLDPIAAFVESEGLTLVVPETLATHHQYTYEGVFRCITLQVHSSLDAVGLTAAVATRLTHENISANVIAGFYHDHIFVSVQDADRAIDALRSFSTPS